MADSTKNHRKIQSDLAFDVIFEHKSYDGNIKLLSSLQNKLVNPIRKNNEK